MSPGEAEPEEVSMKDRWQEALGSERESRKKALLNVLTHSSVGSVFRVC